MQNPKEQIFRKLPGGMIYFLALIQNFYSLFFANFSVPQIQMFDFWKYEIADQFLNSDPTS